MKHKLRVKLPSFGLGNVACLVTGAFVVLKAAGYSKVADWSWWWVFSPMIIYAILMTIVMSLILLITVFLVYMEEK